MTFEADASAARTLPAGAADAVYFLMFDSWPREMRSNRWHYATRWARHLPVVLVQPVLTKDDEPAVSMPEPRIPNVRVLNIRAADPVLSGLATGFLQAKQIYDDMRLHGYAKPIFWTYNPDYLFASELLPAVMRVYHATENYFYFDSVSEGFIDRLKRVLAISDLVLGVSEGVVSSHRRFAKGASHAVTNGCDFPFYEKGGTDDAVVRRGEGAAKTAVYAGNINGRLDFDLLNDMAQVLPDVAFIFFGPVTGVAGTPDADKWATLIARPNVYYEGAAEVERLPSIFASAHVGLIPYKNDPILVDNTFPLKAFEMQSAGLPVVSTFFDALRSELGPGLRMTEEAASFIDAVRTTDRRVLSDSERQEMRRQCLGHDYDGKFATVLGLVRDHLVRTEGVSAPGLALRGMSRYMQSPEQLARLYREAAPGQVGFGSLLGERFKRVAAYIFHSARLVVPKPIKTLVKRMIT